MPDPLFAKAWAERAGLNLLAEDWVRHVGPIEDWAPTCPQRESDPDLLEAWQTARQQGRSK
jgi:hypothetical protein